MRRKSRGEELGGFREGLAVEAMGLGAGLP